MPPKSVARRDLTALVPSSTRRPSMGFCRRTLAILPQACKNPVLCGAFCSHRLTMRWKFQHHDRRHERAHVIQQILSRLHTTYRILMWQTDTTVGGQWMEYPCRRLLLHVAKHMELLLYRMAFSKAEYLSMETLAKRIEYVARVMTYDRTFQLRLIPKQPTYTKPATLQDQQQRLWLLTPSRWQHQYPQHPHPTHHFVMINGNNQSYQSIVSSMTPVSRKQVHSTPQAASLASFQPLFDGGYTPLLLHVFGFLPGHTIAQCFVLNRACCQVLPHAIVNLRMDTLGLQQLLQYLKKHNDAGLSNLQHLSVSPATDHPDSQRIGPTAMFLLASFLHANKCPVLQTLCLNGVLLPSMEGQHAIYQLVTALASGHCRRLESLLLRGNGIGDYGAMHISRWIASNQCPKLVCLDLRSNFIGHFGLRCLVHTISHSRIRLRQLQLGDNLITSDAFRDVWPRFQQRLMPTLVFLGLESNYLHADDVKPVAQSILDYPTSPLRELCIGGNAGLSPQIITHVFRDVADRQSHTWGLFQANLDRVVQNYS